MKMKPNRCLLSCLAAASLALGPHTLRAAPEAGVTYTGGTGPGHGKNIVFLSGDEEYRSEEGLPMLAKILAKHHGFHCQVLFAINPETGAIDPNNQTNIPGMAALQEADLVVMLLRFRELPDRDMKYFVDYLNAGKPIVALRTSTHAFAYSRNKKSPYAKYDWQSKEWSGGFGRQVLGDTWINHHGNHGKESTRGIIPEPMRDHPILRGVNDIWVPTDVYGITHLPENAQVLVYGQVLSGMHPDDPPVKGPKNDPMMPVAWIRNYTGETGHASRIFCTTMGASVDLKNEDLRRLLVNACYWGLKMEDRIPAKSNVAIVGEYHPTFFGFNGYKRGVKPEDLK